VIYEVFRDTLKEDIIKDPTRKSWSNAVRCLDINKWYTTRDVPEDKREQFLQVVQRGVTDEDLKI